MRAVRARRGAVQVCEVPEPTGTGVRVRVASAGICGSDLHLLDVEGVVGPDTTLGHEVAGWTENGTPVAIEPIDPCGACDPCRRGDTNLCVDGGQMLFGIGLDGGMADQIMVPERTLIRLPVGVEPRDASLVEPLAVVVHSLRKAGVHPTDRVAVIGGGTIGLSAVAALRALGCDVTLFARHDAQRAVGERLGASAASGDGFDLVVESAGSESALASAVEIARPGTTVVIPGIYWGPVAVPGLSMCLKQISLCPTTLYSRHAGGRDVDHAAALLATTPDFADVVITHRYPLDAAPQAFATAADRASGAIKVVLHP